METATYTNPIRSHDVPDPDAIALSGGGYALVASSFERRPGLPLWYSDDLVDWVPAGFAGGYALALHESGGVWAPSIREHDGRLWITWADPDRGVFAVDAPTLGGPWSGPRLLLAGPGPIDPCPFWDDDGRTWIVHGWARSRAGFANRLDVVEVDRQLTHALSAPRVLIDGDAIEGCTVLEGPKLYRRGAELWLFAPAGGVETGWQYAFRAPSLDGPWEGRIVLEQGSTAVNGPHQGAWVIGQNGEEWFLHFQHTPAHGRILHLQPLAWGEDGWPHLGAAVDGGPPEPVSEWRRPTSAPPAAVPPTSSIGQWHARGADPTEIVVSFEAERIQLVAGGCLARPLDARSQRIEITLSAGNGKFSLLGERARTLRIADGRVTVSDGGGESESGVVAALPARVGAEFDCDRARFLVSGEPLGGWFALAPSQWTGVEFAIAACGPERAVFERLSVVLS